MAKSKALSQCLDIQNFTYNAVMAMRRDMAKEDGALSVSREDSQAVVAMVKAWESACDRARILRGKPMPGSLRPTAKPKRARQPGAPTGPIMPE